MYHLFSQYSSLQHKQIYHGLKNWTKKIEMTAMGKFQDKSRTFGKFKENFRTFKDIPGQMEKFQDFQDFQDLWPP